MRRNRQVQAVLSRKGEHSAWEANKSSPEVVNSVCHILHDQELTSEEARSGRTPR